MKAPFADTFFYIALIDDSDSYHLPVRRFIDAYDEFFITTRWILTETADALARIKTRRAAASFLERVENDPDTLIVKSTDELYLRGVKLYTARPDKEWSLTDCISFEVMRDHKIDEALTGDRHFTQAGFKAIFAQA